MISRPFLDLADPPQYGPRGFRGRARCERRTAASVEIMSARGNGDRNKPPIDEAALSARLQRLGEGLARQRASEPSNDASENRAATAAGYAKGFRLSSELVAGVIVGAGLGWLIDRWFGISPWGLIVFLLLGFAAGVLNVMRSAGVVASPGFDDRLGKDQGN
jgi:ATP synthase protein I